MGLRAKSTFRVLILAGVVVVVGGGLGGAIYVRRAQRARENENLRALGLESAAKGETVAVVDQLGSYLVNKGNAVDAKDVEVLKAYAAAKMKLPDGKGENLRDAMARFRELVALVPENEGYEYRRELLKIYAGGGMGTEAVQTADAILKHDPKDAEALVWKAQGLMVLRKMDDAFKCVQDALAVKPLLPQAVDAAMSIMISRGDKGEEIVKWATEQTKGMEDKPEAQYALARAYAADRDADAAKQAALKASLAAPATPEFGLEVANMLEYTEQFTEAAAYLQTYAPKLNDENFTAEYCRHLVYGKQFDKLLQMKPEGEAAKQPTVVAAMRAIAAFELKKPDEGKAILAALEVRGKRWDYAAGDWSRLLTLLYATDNPRQRAILDAANDAKQRNDREPFFRLYFGDAYANTGDVGEAIEQWRKAGSLGLGWSRPFLRLAGEYQSLKLPSVALAVARAADERMPNDRDTMMTIAASWAAALPAAGEKPLAGVGPADELLAYIGKIQSMFPGEETTLPLQVDLLVRMDRKPAAVALIEDTLKQTPPPGESTLLALASVSVRDKLDREEQCLALNEKARGITPDGALERCNVMVLKGQKDEARKYMADARAKAGDKNADAWGIVWCRLLDILGDGEAAAQWKALVASPAAQEDVQVFWAALSSPASRKDHAFIGKVLDRLETLNGETGMQWRVEKSRWLLENKDDRKAQDEAMKLLTDSARLWPNVPKIHELLAEAYENASNLLAANQELIRAAELDSENPRMKLLVGQALLRHGDSVRAITYLRGVADLPAATNEQKMQAGVLLAQAGEKEVSAQLLAASAANNPQAQGILAGLYWQTGRLAEAEKSFKLALDKPTALLISQAAAFYQAIDKPQEAERVIGMLSTIKADPGEKEFIEGVFRARRGQVKEALDLLKKSTTAAPGNGNAWRWLIATQLNDNQIDEAIKTAAMARTALLDDPVDKVLTRSGGNVQKMLENPLARAYVIDCIVIPAENSGVEDVSAAFSATGPVELAEKISAAADRNHDALPLQILAIRMKQAASQDFLGRGQSKGAHDMLNDALTIAKRAMITNPTSPLPALYTTECYAALGQWEDARQAAERWRANLTTNTDDASMAIAQMDLQLNRGKEAEDLLQAQLKDAQGTPQYRTLLVNLAEAKVRQGQTDAADALLWPVAKDDAAVRGAFCQIAATFVPNIAAATNWLGRAEALLKSEDFVSRFAVGDCYLIAGYRFKDKAATDHGLEMMIAASQAKEATKVQQEELVLRLGMAFEKLDDQANAEKYYRAVLALDDKADVAMNNLASVLAKRGSLDEAATLIRKALALRSIPNYQDTLAFVLQKSGQNDEAVKALQAAIDMDPGNPMWLVNMADLYLATSKTEQARSMLVRVEAMHLDFAKVDPEVKAKYDRIRAALPKPPGGEL